MSSTEETTPPEAMMSRLIFQKASCRAPRFVPAIAPSFEMSVHIMVLTPASSMRVKKSSQLTPVTSVQPLMATSPSLMSALTAMASEPN